jgi:ppGpp synthetase/RelA/SpoT-type nucleotidyltranferase
MAGYRLVVWGAPTQQLLVQQLSQEFAGARIHDRRGEASHGYRAVHVIALSQEYPIEVQIRTVFQHLWAQLSERLSDTLKSPGIKYGEYPTEFPDVGRILAAASDAIASFEAHELMGDRGLTRERARLLRRLDQALLILGE